MNAFTTILSAIPGIIAAIKAIEAAIPGAGLGKAKLDAVLEIVQAANQELAGFLPQITAVIGTLVALFNKVGAWPK